MKIVIVLLCVFVVFCILMAINKSKSSSKQNNAMLVSNQKLNDESNRELFDELCQLFQGYETIDTEQVKLFREKIKNVQNKKDNDLLTLIFQQVFERNWEKPICGTCDILLNKNEEFLFKAKNMSLSKVKTVSRTISGIGCKYAKNGLRSYIGSVSIFPNEQMVLVESIGKVYVTNKRILFLNEEGKSYEIKLNSIIDYIIENDSIIIIVNNGNPFKITTNDNFWVHRDADNDPVICVDSTFWIANLIRKMKSDF